MLYKKYHRNFVRKFKKGAKVRFLVDHYLVRGKFFTILELKINYGEVDVVFIKEDRIWAELITREGILKTRTIELVY